MSEFNIEIEGGKSKRLKTAGKYCDRDIVVTATGGSENLDEVLSAQEALIEELKSELQGKTAGDGGGTKPLPTQEKTLDITENGEYVATADDGYTLSKVTANVNVPIPEGYIKPSGTKEITENGEHDVKSFEVVDVNVPIPDGYIIPSGAKEITTNGEHDVTEVASVVVNVAGSTSTEAEEVAALLGNTMTVLDNSLVTSLRTRACQGATKLETVNLPSVTSLGSYAFYSCSGLKTAKLPKLTSVSTQAFYGCTYLNYADCGQLANLPAQTFNACTSLVTLILRKASVCTLSNTNAISNTAIGKGTGYVYVPSALVESYKAASNWSTFEAQFRAIEDYPEITGG